MPGYLAIRKGDPEGVERTAEQNSIRADVRKELSSLPGWMRHSRVPSFRARYSQLMTFSTRSCGT